MAHIKARGPATFRNAFRKRTPYAGTYTVYHVASTMEKKTYKREHLARALADKLGSDYAYARTDHYNANVVHMVERVNLMSGKKYMEPSNTPGYMSPACEAYWSM